MKKKVTKVLSITYAEYSVLDEPQTIQLVTTIGYMKFDVNDVCSREVHTDNEEVRQCLMTLVRWLLEDLWSPRTNAEIKKHYYNLAHKIIEVFEK